MGQSSECNQKNPSRIFLAKRCTKTETPKSNPKLRWLLSCTRHAKNRTLGYTILAAKNTLACFMAGRTRATTILSLIGTRRAQPIRPCGAGPTPKGTIRSIAVLTMLPKEYSPREMHMKRQWWASRQENRRTWKFACPSEHRSKKGKTLSVSIC